MRISFLLILTLGILAGNTVVLGDADTDPSAPMDNGRLDKLIKRIDSKAEGRPGYWSLKYQGYQAQIITDEKADRMRILVGISTTDKLEKGQLLRLMQANFDSALDARYCIAQNIIWAAFIHPLSILSEEEFFSGLGQTINLAATYGSTFSSGAFIFKGGDSQGLQDKYYREIMKKGKTI